MSLTFLILAFTNVLSSSVVLPFYTFLDKDFFKQKYNFMLFKMYDFVLQGMFTEEEATSFLENSWGIRNVKNKLGADRKNLLDEIIVIVQAKVPFQSITLMATSPNERIRPTLEDIKRDCMAGIGGLCYCLNVFTWGLLKGLGFSAKLCRAKVTASQLHPNNHVLVLVSNLKENGDLYLVDCGCGFPTFRAIPLNFDQESAVYQDSYLEYKYVRYNGQILRMHGQGDKIKRTNREGIDFFLGKWRRFYFFAVEPTDCLADLDSAFDDVYTVPGTTPFDRSPRAVWFPGQYAVMTVNNRLMLEKEEEKGKLETTPMESDDEIIKCYCSHFPMLKQDTVRRAIVEWRRLLV